MKFSELKRCQESSESGPGWIMECPVISTSHLEERDIETLKGRQRHGDSLVGLNLAIVKTDVGIRLDTRLSTSALYILISARGLGYSWVRFDSIGIVFDDLPTFDW